MKKLLALILASLILSSGVSCAKSETAEKTKETAKTAVTETVKANGNIATITGANPTAKKALESIERLGYEGVVYVVKEGKVFATYEKGNLNGKPITIDTPMPIASISKQFCAAAILLLQEQGKLSIDDTLDKYYPEYKYGKKITLRHLLSMRSGIHNYTDYMSECEKFATDDKTYEESFDSLKDWIFSRKLYFEPDTNFYYSNCNYSLLSDIVEQISGKKYIDFLRETFFNPLGMTHTGAISELDSSPEWAQGYNYDREELTCFWKLTKGDGCLISNGEDMVRWSTALRTGKVISPESYKAMATEYSDSKYGFGLEFTFPDGIGHAGFADAYTAVNYVNENKDLQIFMVSNTPEPSCDSLFDDLYLDLLK